MRMRTRARYRACLRRRVCAAEPTGPPVRALRRRPAQAVTLTTNLGSLKVELACGDAPKSCENFLAHCAAGTYDGTLFFRNIAGFVVQGGDPTGTGKGGETIWGGLMDEETSDALLHDARGVVALNNRGPGTTGCQFFITYAPAAHLDGKYSVIGRVIDGFPTLDAMEAVPVGRKHRPEQDIKIERVHIHANPFAEAAVGGDA